MLARKITNIIVSIILLVLMGSLFVFTDSVLAEGESGLTLVTKSADFGKVEVKKESEAININFVMNYETLGDKEIVVEQELVVGSSTNSNSHDQFELGVTHVEGQVSPEPGAPALPTGAGFIPVKFKPTEVGKHSATYLLGVKDESGNFDVDTAVAFEVMGEAAKAPAQPKTSDFTPIAVLFVIMAATSIVIKRLSRYHSIKPYR